MQTSWGVGGVQGAWCAGGVDGMVMGSEKGFPFGQGHCILFYVSKGLILGVSAGSQAGHMTKPLQDSVSSFVIQMCVLAPAQDVSEYGLNSNAWVQILHPPHSSCVSTRKSSSSLVPQFPHLHNGDNDSSQRLDGLIYIKHLEHTQQISSLLAW